MGAGITKDAIFARWFGAGDSATRAIPRATFGLFAVRDTLTIAAAFTVPPLVASAIVRSGYMEEKRAADAAQIISPMGMQLICTPIHLMALESFNKPNATVGQRALSAAGMFPQSTLARSAIALSLMPTLLHPPHLSLNLLPTFFTPFSNHEHNALSAGGCFRHPHWQGPSPLPSPFPTVVFPITAPSPVPLPPLPPVYPLPFAPFAPFPLSLLCPLPKQNGPSPLPYDLTLTPPATLSHRRMGHFCAAYGIGGLLSAAVLLFTPFIPFAPITPFTHVNLVIHCPRRRMGRFCAAYGIGSLLNAALLLFTPFIPFAPFTPCTPVNLVIHCLRRRMRRFCAAYGIGGLLNAALRLVNLVLLQSSNPFTPSTPFTSFTLSP
jgi:hypothetical protein